MSGCLRGAAAASAAKARRTNQDALQLGLIRLVAVARYRVHVFVAFLPHAVFLRVDPRFLAGFHTARSAPEW
jgi:hypothetical protein